MKVKPYVVGILYSLIGVAFILQGIYKEEKFQLYIGAAWTVVAIAKTVIDVRKQGSQNPD